MSTADWLSQEDIEGLLDGVEGGDFASANLEFLPQGEIKPYDFGSQERGIGGGQIRTLEMIHDRFAGALRTSLFQWLGRAPDVVVSGIQLQKYADYMDRQRSPLSLNSVRMAPLRGLALIVMDPRLVFTVVDHVFGGNGHFGPEAQGREFSRTEMRVIRKILDRVFNGLKDAWEPVLSVDFDYLESETNPNYTAVAGRDDYVMTATLNITLEGNGGDLTLLLPYAMIEPISGVLEASYGDGEEADPQWRMALRNRVTDASVDVSSVLAEKSLSVGDLMRLEIGDIIPIEMPQILSLQVEGVPVFTGRPCTSEGHCAVQVIEKI
ncbi:flagellar motor switch protein FliM [Methylomicrobium lacus]|uniref:flagellar motor switch protein FliM n=1 Tax=Methylomicrobium lacus TaxID=136992 RepID=UPI0035A8590A